MLRVWRRSTSTSGAIASEERRTAVAADRQPTTRIDRFRGGTSQHPGARTCRRSTPRAATGRRDRIGSSLPRYSAQRVTRPCRRSMLVPGQSAHGRLRPRASTRLSAGRPQSFDGLRLARWIARARDSQMGIWLVNTKLRLQERGSGAQRTGWAQQEVRECQQTPEPGSARGRRGSARDGSSRPRRCVHRRPRGKDSG